MGNENFGHFSSDFEGKNREDEDSDGDVVRSVLKAKIEDEDVVRFRCHCHQSTRVSRGNREGDGQSSHKWVPIEPAPENQTFRISQKVVNRNSEKLQKSRFSHRCWLKAGNRLLSILLTSNPHGSSQLIWCLVALMHRLQNMGLGRLLSHQMSGCEVGSRAPRASSRMIVPIRPGAGGSSRTSRTTHNDSFSEMKRNRLCRPVSR